MPGTYNESIAIPANNSIRGINLQAVTISPIVDISGPTGAVYMGSNTRLEDVTVNINTNVANNISGIVFGDGTATTAKVRTVVINAVNNYTGSPNNYSVYGIQCTDTISSASVSSFNAVQRTTINVSGNTSSGTCCGIINSGTSFFSVRDSTVYCSGTDSGTYIGAYNSGTGSINIKTSTLSGTGSTGSCDISRTPVGSLFLNATDLIHSTAGINSFNVGTSTNTIYFSIYSNGLSGGNYHFDVNKTYELSPGSTFVPNYNQGQGVILHSPIYFPKACVLYAVMLSRVTKSSPSTPENGKITFNFKKNGVVFLTQDLNFPSQTYAINNGNSTTFNIGDYLTVSVICTLTTGNFYDLQSISCSVAIY